MSTTDTDRDLVTPTARIETDAEAGTPPWFEARRGGITGTDLPKILGDSKYGNTMTVWLDKRGELPPEDEDLSEAGEWGHILEDPVAQTWATRNKVTVQRIGVISNTDNPWQRASLDRLVYGCDEADGGPCGLEVKTRSAFKAGSFREDIPDDVLAQVAWGRRVSGLQHMHIAVLIGGQKLLQFTYYADEELEDFLIKEATPIWQAVETGTPPDVEPDSDGVMLDLLNRMYSNRAGEVEVEDPDKARQWLDQYAEGGDLEATGKALKEQAKTGLIMMIDDGEVGKIDGAVAFTYKRPRSGVKMNAPQIEKLRTKEPETYARMVDEGYLIPNNPSPRFNRK